MGNIMRQSNTTFDYNRPISLADDVYWVGFSESGDNEFFCNPYLIVDGEEAVLIDGGSRPDFSTVMRKILLAGISPNQISHLIYQHYDPDLCGSLPNLEEMINRPDLKIISKKENNRFIRHYKVNSELLCIDDMAHTLTLKSGRILRFFLTPYAHAQGSFVTLDEKHKILFTSDLFGGLNSKEVGWSLFFKAIDSRCATCCDPIPEKIEDLCLSLEKPCPWSGIHLFHKNVMPSTAALRYALREIKKIDANMLAPQHGSVIQKPEIEKTIERLYALDDVGIDALLGDEDGA
ncbi:MBL fold metallo-hydrolase [Magnetococcales bacterium HHB-1]